MGPIGSKLNNSDLDSDVVDFKIISNREFHKIISKREFQDVLGSYPEGVVQDLSNDQTTHTWYA